MNKIKLILIMWLLCLAAQPLVQAQIIETYTFSTNRPIPDGNPAGLADVRTLNSAIVNITSVTVGLNTAGQFNGDLYSYLVHSNGFVVLLNRPGKTASNPYGYADSGLNVTFQNGAANGDIHLYQNVIVPTPGSPLTGIWQPDERNTDPATVLDTSPRNTSLTNLVGINASGVWSLFLADMQSGGTNALTEWTLTITGEAAPTITWANPANIIYGTALSSAQLDATATFNSTNVPGTFTYNPPIGTVLHAGGSQTLSVTFTPTNPNLFVPVTASVTINVQQATPVITWANPAGIGYGTALSGTQLDATANTPGTFAYTPAAGTVLQAGNNQSLSTTFTPTDTTDYTSANASVSINVSQASTTGAISSSANPALPGANVTFTMTVSPVAPATSAPTGGVNFRTNGVIAGSATLINGVATFSLSTLPHGSNTVVAEYAGDPNYIGTTNALAPKQVINTPPVAGNLTIYRYPTNSTKISIASILASCSDADGDTLSVNVSATSANGGTITVVSGWAIYTPPQGFANADSFTYAVSDGFGGSAVGTITVDIETDNSVGQNLTITSLGGGSYLISGYGVPGYTYNLQHTATLNPANWQNVSGGTLTASSTGQFQFTDTPSGGEGYYRTVFP